MTLLFLAEIDNALFAVLLPERACTRIEEAGHVKLEHAQLAALARTKPIHIILILAAVLLALSLANAGESSWEDIATIPFPFFWAAGVAEAFVAGRSAAKVTKEIGQTTGAAWLGYFVFKLLLELSRF